LTPIASPTDAPIFAPSITPTTSPTDAPTFAPTLTPIASPTDAPTFAPTLTPIASPTGAPIFAPSITPTTSPTGAPTFFSDAYVGYYLAEYASGPSSDISFSTLSAAQTACRANPTCNGITKEPTNNNIYSLRKGTTLFASSTGETSWLYQRSGGQASPILIASPTGAPTIAAYYVVIDKVVDSSHDINLGEVQLFNNGSPIPRDQLTFTLNGQYNNYPASLCNDGNIYNFCNSAHSDPALTIVSTMPFDKVVVYNRNDCCQHRIVGATITVGINGQLKATTFPSATAVYTFAVYPSALQLV
jgi:hypothetical protein